VLGAILSLWARTHEILATSPEREFSRWTHASFDSADARAIVAYTLAGIAPPKATLAKAPTTDAKVGIFFAASVKECDEQNPHDLGSAADVRTKYVTAGGRWKAFALAIDSLPPDDRMRAFVAGWELACSH
jgi:hypothetical protein